MVAALVLAGCATTGPAPVEDLSLDALRPAPQTRTPESRPAGTSNGAYQVQRGDTLYSIAFRHGVDYRDLAAWNGIATPYTIYVGQALRVMAPARAPNAAVAAEPVSPAQPAASVTVAVTPAKRGAPDLPKPAPFETVTAQSARARAPEQVPSTTPEATLSTAQSPAARAPAATGSPSPSTKPVGSPALTATPPGAAVASAEIVWRWPADGQVVDSYVGGDPMKQGIDIAGKSGDPVRAAANGTVVYSGNGLIGYGELIIIKHSPAFLSAYGHNRRRLVKEGDRVSAGQVIAEMGSSSASRDSLHFEIRKNGKPANPVDYLPRR